MKEYFPTFFTVPQVWFWKPWDYDLSKIQTICIFSEGDKIGDALFKVPLLKTLKKAFPQARITYLSLVYTAWKTILTAHAPTFLDEVHENVDINNLSQYGTFDVVIDLNHRAKVTRKVQHIPHRYFVSNTYGGIFGSFFSLYPMKKVHRVARHMVLLRKLGVDDREMVFDPTLPIPENISHEVSLAYTLKDAIVLLPAAGDRRRCWNLENYKALAHQLLNQKKKIIALFGPQDDDMYQEFKLQFQDKIIFPLQEHPSWMDDYHYTMALCGQSQLCIGNDSGVTHIAVAGGAKLLALYGRVPPDRAAVIGDHHAVLYKGRSIDLISIDDVSRMIEKMIV